MRTVEPKVYQFSELSEGAKSNAISSLSHINVDYEWWESVYMDAENVGIKITSFDIDRASYVKSEIYDHQETANKIIAEHGEMCETCKVAQQFIADYAQLVTKHSDGIKLDVVAEDNEYEFDTEADDLQDEFKKSIEEEYLSILREEYEYLTSDEAIIETIEANAYEFTENGEIF